MIIHYQKHFDGDNIQTAVNNIIKFFPLRNGLLNRVKIKQSINHEGVTAWELRAGGSLLTAINVAAGDEIGTSPVSLNIAVDELQTLTLDLVSLNGGELNPPVVLQLEVSEVNEVDNLTTIVLNLNTTYEEQMLIVNAALASLDSEVDGLGTTVGGLSSTVSGLSSTVSGHTSSISTINSTLTGHNDRLNILEAGSGGEPHLLFELANGGGSLIIEDANDHDFHGKVVRHGGTNIGLYDDIPDGFFMYPEQENPAAFARFFGMDSPVQAVGYANALKQELGATAKIVRSQSMITLSGDIYDSSAWLGNLNNLGRNPDGGSFANLYDGDRTPNGSFGTNGAQFNGTADVEFEVENFSKFNYVTNRLTLITANASNLNGSSAPTPTTDGGYAADLNVDLYGWKSGGWTFLGNITNTLQIKTWQFPNFRWEKFKFQLNSVGGGALYALEIEVYGFET